MLLEQTKYKFGCVGESKRKNFDLTCVTPFSKVAQFSARRDFLALDFFCREK